MLERKLENVVIRKTGLHLSKLPKDEYAQVQDVLVSFLTENSKINYVNLEYTDINEQLLKNLIALPQIKAINLAGTRITERFATILHQRDSYLEITTSQFDDEAWEMLKKNNNIAFYSEPQPYSETSFVQNFSITNDFNPQHKQPEVQEEKKQDTYKMNS